MQTASYVGSNGVAERCKIYAHQRGYQATITKFLKWELLLKERICSKREHILSRSDFFPLRAVPYGMENHFYHIR